MGIKPAKSSLFGVINVINMISPALLHQVKYWRSECLMGRRIVCKRDVRGTSTIDCTQSTLKLDHLKK